MKKPSQQEFIDKCILKHGDKYDYSKIIYVNSSTKITIICPTHGEFEQSPNNHLNGGICPDCAKSKRDISNHVGELES